MFDRFITTALGETLIASIAVVGAKWAWRFVRLLHAMLYVIPWTAACGLYGWLIWGSPEATIGYGCFGGGLLFLLMCWSWFKEWRFYRRHPEFADLF